MTPAAGHQRPRGVEYLDAPHVDPALVRRSLRDVSVANRLFGGTRAVLAELGRTLADARGQCLTLLDVGTGAADIPLAARRAAAEHGVELTTLGLDVSPALVEASLPFVSLAVLGDARALPFRPRSIDIITCSQVLHHFSAADSVRLIREMDRTARLRVIVSDIRRSVGAAAGLWLASFPLGFHPVSRHDGVVSVMRGYSTRELRHLVRGALGRTPDVRRRAGFRLTASWRPGEGAP
jgi:hypothetical protein